VQDIYCPSFELNKYRDIHDYLRKPPYSYKPIKFNDLIVGIQ